MNRSRKIASRCRARAVLTVPAGGVGGSIGTTRGRGGRGFRGDRRPMTTFRRCCASATSREFDTSVVSAFRHARAMPFCRPTPPVEHKDNRDIDLQATPLNPERIIGAFVEQKVQRHGSQCSERDGRHVSRRAGNRGEWGRVAPQLSEAKGKTSERRCGTARNRRRKSLD